MLRVKNINMNKTLLFSFLGFVFFQVSSCDLIDEPEEIPSYIQIDTIRVQSQMNSEGSSSHNIKDAWLFVNNQLIGAFELPMRAPVLEEGEQLVEVFAGIDDNGVIAIPEVYPFYDRYRATKTLKRGEVLVVEPTVLYNDDAVFGFIEDFELGNLFGADIDGNDLTRIEITNTGKFEGQRSGVILLNEENPIFEHGTANFYELYDENNPTSPVYVELNYKNNIPFEVGIIGFENNALVEKVYVTGMNPSDKWNKIYINMSLDINSMKADNYQIVIRAIKPQNVETGEIFLDNIKLLHF
jgi:hypothetical protein